MEIQNISTDDLPELENSKQETVTWKSHTVTILSALPDDLYAEARERIREIGAQLEKYRSFANGDTNVISLQGTVSYPANGTYTVSKEQIQKIGEGISGSYFLLDLDGNKKLIVKPIDEDCGCINNPKGWGTSYLASPVREDMPLYLSSLKEAATYAIASAVGLTSIAPKTGLKIFESEQFFIQPNLQQFIPSKEKLCSAQEFIPNAKALCQVGYPTPLASELPLTSFFQEATPWPSSNNVLLYSISQTELMNLMVGYLESFDPKSDLELLEKKQLVLKWAKNQLSLTTPSRDFSLFEQELFSEWRKNCPHALDLFRKIYSERKDPRMKQVIQELEAVQMFFAFQSGVSSWENVLFDPQQYEDLLILIWTTYDTDAHLGNILAYRSGSNENGEPIYGLKKIDNGLTFPTKNRNLRNPLIFYPNADALLSDEGRKKILAMDEQALVQVLSFYDLESAVPAFCQRLQTLKSLAEKPTITLKEIDNKMVALEYQYEEDSFSNIFMPSGSYA